LDSHEESLLRRGLVGVILLLQVTGIVEPQPIDLLLRKVPDLVRRVWQNESKDLSEPDSQRAFDEEQPPPTRDPISAVQLEYSDSEQRAKGVTKLAAGVEYRCAERNLLPVVEHGR
jgi:hypothetical protein